MGRRRKREEKKRKRRRKKEEEKKRRRKESKCGIHVWNFYMETKCVWIMYGNLSLSKLCRKNPIRSIVGWYKMSFMVYFEF